MAEQCNEGGDLVDLTGEEQELEVGVVNDGGNWLLSSC